jgi:hypothetical protein
VLLTPPSYSIHLTAESVNSRKLVLPATKNRTGLGGGKVPVRLML